MTEKTSAPISLVCFNKGNRYFWKRQLNVSDETPIQIYHRPKDFLEGLHDHPQMVIIDAYFAKTRPDDVTPQKLLSAVKQRMPGVIIFYLSPGAQSEVMVSPPNSVVSPMSQEILDQIHNRFSEIQQPAA